MIARWLLFLILFSFSSMVEGALFESKYNHRSGEEIIGIQICGERCSGTTFIAKLLRRNFPEMQESEFQRFGLKHFLWWFGMPVDRDKLKRLRYNIRAATLEGSEHHLFIVIVRNPYDWLRSFYLKPHHVSAALKGKGFFHFISEEWRVKEENSQVPLEIDGYNPYTGGPFKNVLELRKYKNINYLQLADLVDNFCLIRYEEVEKDPEQFIAFIENFSGLEKRQEFVPVSHYKGLAHKPIYVQRKYFSLKGRVLRYINRNIDWEVEERLGYFLQPNKVR